MLIQRGRITVQHADFSLKNWNFYTARIPRMPSATARSAGRIGVPVVARSASSPISAA